MVLDPFSALSLAGNIVQFIDFGCKLCSTSKELYRSADGALQSNVLNDVVVKDLHLISSKLGTTGVNQTGAQQTPEEESLLALSKSCKQVADLLIGTLQDLVVKSPKKNCKLRAKLSGPDRQSNLAQFLNRLSREHDNMRIDNANRLEKLKAHLIDVVEKRHSNTASNLDMILKNLEDLRREADDASRIQAILQSLQYDSMRTRQSEVVQAHEKTFEWIFQTSNNHSAAGASLMPEAAPTHNFLTWLSSGSNNFWIAGKAGSGKSTLLKFLCGDSRTREHLLKWSGTKKLVTGNFFFWNAGTHMQKSQEGLLQSLLFEVLRQCPAVAPDLVPYRWGENPRWAIATLWSRWETVEALCRLNTVSQDRDIKFCFFIDGLDEYQGDHQELVQVLQDFTKSPNVKLCMSSRPWNVFRDAFAGVPDHWLMLQDYTKEDIRLYVHENLDKHPRFASLKSTNQEYSELVSNVVERAQGVFLWVYFVVRSLGRGLINADRLLELKERLEQFPPDLEKYFTHMLNSIEPIYRKQTSKLLLTCLDYDGPIGVLALSFVDEPDPDYATKIEIGTWTNEEIMQRCADMSVRVNAHCTDLLEVRYYPENRVSSQYEVSFLHRTVRDFLMQDQLMDRLKVSLDGDFDVNLSLCKAFLAQVKILDMNQLEYRSNEILLHLSQTKYPLKSIMGLMIEADQLLHARTLASSEHVELEPGHRIFHSIEFKETYDGAYIIRRAMFRGFHSYVEEYLNRQMTDQMEHSPPLVSAQQLLQENLLPFWDYWGPFDCNVLQLLFLYGADPNCEFQYPTHGSIWTVQRTIDLAEGGRTVWHALLFLFREERGVPHDRISLYFQICEIFISNGADCQTLMFVSKKRGRRSVYDVLKDIFGRDDAVVLLQTTAKTYQRDTMFGFLKRIFPFK